EEGVMTEQQLDIIGLANDRERSIRDYAVFDPTTMSTGLWEDLEILRALPTMYLWCLC
ncbi:hypothetical protein A2U01_0040342, partial [Trifolium medium]|nr:hypothetical protein [Trifolium medium]